MCCPWPGRDFAAFGEYRMEPKRSSKIEYINQKAPRIERPAYRGQRYEAQVPDTLDPAEMAALAVNGITGPTDPEADYEIYWRVAFNTNPPVMWHHESDVVQSKFMEALPLLRLASGSEQNPHVEHRWMEVIRQMQPAWRVRRREADAEIARQWQMVVEASVPAST